MERVQSNTSPESRLAQCSFVRAKLNFEFPRPFCCPTIRSGASGQKAICLRWRAPFSARCRGQRDEVKFENVTRRPPPPRPHELSWAGRAPLLSTHQTGDAEALRACAVAGTRLFLCRSEEHTSELQSLRHLV